jgi:callose synthase
MQIHAAVYALRNTRGLPWPKDHVKNPGDKNTGKDLLDWLQAMFGFQVTSLSEQFLLTRLFMNSVCFKVYSF